MNETLIRVRLLIRNSLAIGNFYRSNAIAWTKATLNKNIDLIETIVLTIMGLEILIILILWLRKK